MEPRSTLHKIAAAAGCALALTAAGCLIAWPLSLWAGSFVDALFWIGLAVFAAGVLAGAKGSARPGGNRSAQGSVADNAVATERGPGDPHRPSHRTPRGGLSLNSLSSAAMAAGALLFALSYFLS